MRFFIIVEELFYLQLLRAKRQAGQYEQLTKLEATMCDC